MFSDEEIRNESIRHALEVAEWAEKRNLNSVAEVRKQVADKLKKSASVTIEMHRSSEHRLSNRK